MQSNLEKLLSSFSLCSTKVRKTSIALRPSAQRLLWGKGIVLVVQEQGFPPGKYCGQRADL